MLDPDLLYVTCTSKRAPVEEQLVDRRASGICLQRVVRFANDKKKAFGPRVLLQVFQLYAAGSAYARLQFELRQAQTCFQFKTNVAETV